MSLLFARVLYQGRPWSAAVDGDKADLFEGDWLRDGKGSTVHRVSLEEITWLPPVEPRTILCVGRNYQAHAAEMNSDVPKTPLFFLKQLGALNAHQAIVHRPVWAGRLDYEGELVLVMGKTVRNVTSSDEAMAAVAGMTVGNDYTARELQSSDGQWTRAKGFDDFAPVGPWVLMDNHPEGRRVTTAVNGTIRQDASTDEMIFGCDRLIMEASRFMTLHPGDLIFTGTPSGIGPVGEGDIVTVTVQGIGTLSNSIKNGD
ncbi:MAG: fumarylacetoacetate hydrolase family protein [Firmicutes bacterium]|nr:fumarylacetoacetate hydrolase family protein [Bacillota bacterium]